MLPLFRDGPRARVSLVSKHVEIVLRVGRNANPTNLLLLLRHRVCDEQPATRRDLLGTPKNRRTLEMMSMAMSTFSASYTRRRIFFSSYC